jgi:hypothetical protein
LQEFAKDPERPRCGTAARILSALVAQPGGSLGTKNLQHEISEFGSAKSGSPMFKLSVDGVCAFAKIRILDFIFRFRALL